MEKEENKIRKMSLKKPRPYKTRNRTVARLSNERTQHAGSVGAMQEVMRQYASAKLIAERLRASMIALMCALRGSSSARLGTGPNPKSERPRSADSPPKAIHTWARLRTASTTEAAQRP